MGFKAGASWQTFIMKGVKTYFLISIVAMFTIMYMKSPLQSAPLIATVGLLTLYSYMVGRLQQKKMVLQINNRFGNLSNSGINTDLRVESLLIVIGLIYFTACLYDNTIPFNKVNLWFFETVNEIYKTPVIGWIIGFFGILFLISTLLKAILFTAMFINNFQSIMSGKKKNDGGDKSGSGNDEYTDFEVMD